MPVGAGQTDGPEVERDRHRGADRVGHRLVIGIESIDPPIVPGQPNQLTGRHIRDGDRQPVAAFLGYLLVVEGQIAESGDAQVLQLAADPVVGEVAAVHTGVSQQSPRRAEQAGRARPGRGIVGRAGQRDFLDLRWWSAGLRRTRPPGSDPTSDPAETPDTRLTEYPASIRATTAPTRPIPLTPPPERTRSAGLMLSARSCSAFRRNPLIGKKFPVKCHDDAIARRMRFLLQVDAEVDGAHDAVAELLVDEFLDGAAVHLQRFVQPVNRGVGREPPFGTGRRASAVPPTPEPPTRRGPASRPAPCQARLESDVGRARPTWSTSPACRRRRPAPATSDLVPAGQRRSVR